MEVRCHSGFTSRPQKQGELKMPIYMKFGDVKGESTEGKHKDWINIESCSFGVVRSGTGAATSGAGGSTTGHAMFQDVSFHKPVDKATPLLFKHACKGLHAKEVCVDFTETNEKGEVMHMQLKLYDAIVSSQSISGQGHGGHTHPTESLTLNFHKIWMSDAPKKTGSGLAAAVKYGWDVRKSEEFSA